MMDKVYRIYLDVCCLNRPFDEQNQLRIRLETEAILAILEQCKANRWKLVSSSALIAEIAQIKDIEQQKQVQIALSIAQIRVLEGQPLQGRTLELVKLGFSFYDAAHIASAEKARADILLSTDDRLVRKAKRLSSKITVRVNNPLKWLTEITQSEN
jgi:predicted nucleic acid-binding protein